MAHCPGMEIEISQPELFCDIERWFLLQVKLWAAKYTL